MKKLPGILLLLFFVFVLDRLMYLPGRMNGVWQYEYGTNVGESISFDDIDIVNNFEVSIVKSKRSNSFYLLGCYFGRLYLYDQTTSEVTKYTALEKIDYTNQ